MVALTTEEHFKVCYDLSKQVFNNSLSRRDAAKELIRICEFDEPKPINATLDLMGILPRLLDGKRLTLIRSQKYFAYCLNRIHKEEHQGSLISPLKSLEKSIEYHFKRGSHKERLRRLHNEFSGWINEMPLYESEPPHKKKKGEGEALDDRFIWTGFYENIADSLLDCKDEQDELYNLIANQRISIHKMVVSPGEMDPFSFISFFNSATFSNRRTDIAKAIADNFSIPYDNLNFDKIFAGIPIRPDKKAYFVEEKSYQNENQFEALWNFFFAAIQFAEEGTPENRSNFINFYTKCPKVYGTSINHVDPKKNELTIGLHWIRPWDYPNLDIEEQKFIEKDLGITIERNGKSNEGNLDGSCDGKNYLEVRDKLLEYFQREGSLIRSFPELSLAARGEFKPAIPVSSDRIPEPKQTGQDIQDDFYAPKIVHEIVEKCFSMEIEDVKNTLNRLEEKKNIILQGPPGTGKTWLAKRLASALKDAGKAETVQFHPSMSYEDFVRGFRPNEDGRLELLNGHFMEMVKKAVEAKKQGKKEKYVMIIEEINRGNPAQIFGELLTLLENTKRKEKEKIALSYHNKKLEKLVYIPDNLYVIGTMNLADRSLAIVDFALRRRFAFIRLNPVLDNRWSDWVVKNCDIQDDGSLVKIGKKLTKLNEIIAKENGLGKEFCIGHSYVTPEEGAKINDVKKWWKDIVETEIVPLLEEYWFDAPADIENDTENDTQAVSKTKTKVEVAKEKLLKDI